MEILTFAKTLFYLSASLAIIFLTVVFLIIMVNAARIVFHLERVLANFEEMSQEAKTTFSDLIGQLKEIPFVSFFSRNKKADKSKKAKKGKTQEN